MHVALIYTQIRDKKLVEDLELLEKYRETKDTTYLATLYRAIYATCIWVLFKVLQNHEQDAEDAVMDIYEKLD